MSAVEEKVCRHGVCNCAAEEGGDYCSPYCEGAGTTTNDTVDEAHEIICDCGHPACVG
ncbi:MAG: hypothetical protein ACRD9R_09875 [Pyrinomonadaceae bacterium]